MLKKPGQGWLMFKGTGLIELQRIFKTMDGHIFKILIKLDYSFSVRVIQSWHTMIINTPLFVSGIIVDHSQYLSS